MITPEPPDSSEPADLTIEVQAHDDKTLTVHRIKRGGIIKFHNRDRVHPLTITALVKSVDADPFIPPDNCDAVSQFRVDPNSHLNVKIANEFDLFAWFYYSAEIQGSAAEDPIVIVDRR